MSAVELAHRGDVVMALVDQSHGKSRELTRGMEYVVNAVRLRHQALYYLILADDGRGYHFLSSLFERVPTSPSPGEWRAIETAPTDGTPILISWRTGAYGEGHAAVDVSWWAGAWCPYSRPATHWQHLPSPPPHEEDDSGPQGGGA
jgi:hypothetical protein